MSYSVCIERVGSDGAPLGCPATETAPSESEAIAMVRRAIILAQSLQHSMHFSVYAPGNRLLMSYTTTMGEQPVVTAV